MGHPIADLIIGATLVPGFLKSLSMRECMCVCVCVRPQGHK